MIESQDIVFFVQLKYEDFSFINNLALCLRTIEQRLLSTDSDVVTDDKHRTLCDYQQQPTGLELIH